jgi:hypothetical protein
MVRIRLYGLFVSIPLLMIIAGFVWIFIAPPTALFWEGGTILLIGGGVLQAIFVGAIACPKCGKSPWMYKDSSIYGKPWADGKCSRCGFPLDGRPDDAPG